MCKNIHLLMNIQFEMYYLKEMYPSIRKCTYGTNELESTSSLCIFDETYIQKNDLYLQDERLHKCQDHTFILNHYVCDGHTDCLNGSDEANCPHVCSFYSHKNCDIEHYLCQSLLHDCYKKCHTDNCTCSDLYFQCESGGCIPSSKICDIYPDCEDESDESSDLCSYNFPCDINENINTTSFPFTGSNNSMDTFDICNRHGSHAILRLDLDHIHEFCDGVSHCESGFDEHPEICQNLTVPVTFRCPREHVFVSLHSVEDNKFQCYSADDELLTNLTAELPDYCQSKGLGLVCENIPNITNLGATKSLILKNHHVSTADMKYIFAHTTKLLILKLRNCSMRKLSWPVFSTLTQLTYLDLSYNPLSFLQQGLFSNNTKLSKLQLSYTYLSDLSVNIFNEILHSLVVLNVSHTSIIYPKIPIIS